MSISSNTSHGGILFPLEAFRPRMLAAAIAEGLVAKARNINDASLRLTRHPEAALVLARVVGSVVDDEGKFWRENADLAMYASQALPRQCFLYFVIPAPERRQGFMVAQRGQVVAADEGTADNMPADATDADWPVARLAQQMRIGLDELEGGFAGGPSVDVSLLDPIGDDQSLLMQLAGQPPDEDASAPAAEKDGILGGTGKGTTGVSPERPSVEEDQKRRAAERLADREQREALAEQASSGLAFVVDELGAVVAPQAELGDADILAPYLVRDLRGDLPPGLPGELSQSLQGKRIDFAVKVEFLSEVFTGAGPLNKATFEEQAVERELDGHALKVMEVLAPRLGAGTLVRRDRAGAFVSRRPDEPLPTKLLLTLLDGQ